MIETLVLNKTAKSKPDSISDPYHWAANVPRLQAGPITFKPGLNILFGPNGSGKSTVAGLCAFLMAAEQGGISVVTEDHTRKLFGSFSSDNQQPVAKLVHDGQPVLYVNPRNEIGLSGGAFDDDFMAMGIGSMFARRQSTGQRSLTQVDHIVRIIMGLGDQKEPAAAETKKKPAKKSKAEIRFSRDPSSSGKKPKFEATPEFPSEIEWRMDRNAVNEVWKQKIDRIKDMLAPKMEKGPKTIIMDEPESGFSIPWQAGFWQNVMASEAAQSFQIIVATHSPFALGIKHAHYIEMEAGYVKECEKLFDFSERNES